MIYSSCLTDDDRLLVLDASVVINLLATGHAPAILAALRVPVLLPEPVLREVENGEQRGHGAATKCRDIPIDGRIAIAQLDSASFPLFMELVSGASATSLGDGEAATIAIAAARRGCAVIDERKANRLLAARFRQIARATTIDVLSHTLVSSRLGKTTLASAVSSAVAEARMHVTDAQFGWVAKTIGTSQVTSMSSLRRFRQSV